MDDDDDLTAQIAALRARRQGSLQDGSRGSSRGSAGGLSLPQIGHGHTDVRTHRRYADEEDADEDAADEAAAKEAARNAFLAFDDKHSSTDPNPSSKGVIGTIGSNSKQHIGHGQQRRAKEAARAAKEERPKQQSSYAETSVPFKSQQSTRALARRPERRSADQLERTRKPAPAAAAAAALQLGEFGGEAAIQLSELEYELDQRSKASMRTSRARLGQQQSMRTHRAPADHLQLVLETRTQCVPAGHVEHTRKTAAATAQLSELEDELEHRAAAMRRAAKARHARKDRVGESDDGAFSQSIASPRLGMATTAGSTKMEVTEELERQVEEARRAAKERLAKNIRARKAKQAEAERAMLETVEAKADALRHLKEERKQKQLLREDNWRAAERARRQGAAIRQREEAEAKVKRETALRAKEVAKKVHDAEKAMAERESREAAAQQAQHARREAEARARRVTKERARRAAAEEEKQRAEAEARALVLRVGLTGGRPKGMRKPWGREAELRQEARQEAILQAAVRRAAAGAELLEWSQQRRQQAKAEDHALEQVLREQPLLPLRELPAATPNEQHQGMLRATSCPAGVARADVGHLGSGLSGLGPLTGPTLAVRRSRVQVCEGWEAWEGKPPQQQQAGSRAGRIRTTVHA
jgi:hypothetical protein